MRIRIVLPPNLAVCAPRDAIPVKLEFQTAEGAIALPEKLAMDHLAGLEESGRLAAFALLQWCGGKLSSFLQLDRSQLSQLVDYLRHEPAFFWANQPKQPIPWEGNDLKDVASLLALPRPAAAAQERPSEASSGGPSAPENRMAGFAGEPMSVDGTEHFLAIRLPSKEHPCYDEIRELLLASRFKLEPRNRRWWLRDRHATLNFLAEQWDNLIQRYGAAFTDGFTRRMKDIADAKIEAEAVEGNNGYTVNVSLSAGKASDQEISQGLNSGRRYIESEGRTYLIRQSKLESLQKAQAKLSAHVSPLLLHRGQYKISFAEAAEMEDALLEINPNFETPGTWRERSRALKDLSSLALPVLSEALQQILRPYQKTGCAWLSHLYRYELGGILADEMGLGKTVQALAFLESLSQGKTPALSLIVCPASLVENWRREAARFCPKLRVFAHHGARRLGSAEEVRGYDLVITSYGTLIRDQPLFSAIDWHCLIGDEAQHIKNRRTRNAKTIGAMRAKGRFLLTGTPIENSIQDLASLLDFILPGSFKGVPAGAKGEDRQWHERRLLEQAAPYILRRTKQAVASELPEKLEQILFVEMSAAQRKTYEAARLQAESAIAALETGGASEGAVRMKTLTQLLRLRQVCCDPRLVDESAAGEDSAKLGSFLELLEESIDGGHRMLVFSQFVSLLTLLRRELDEQEIGYCYLDGSTRDRMAEVDRFNADGSIPVFLISLKAGGTGLNLTAADTVVHFDPWWNPAAEAQATDRAHRIGQTKVVTSYKLIVSDSVEEKVLQLQNQKRQLLQDIFEASEAANAKISLADLKELL